MPQPLFDPPLFLAHLPLVSGERRYLRYGLFRPPSQAVEFSRRDPVEVRQGELAVAGFDLPVLAGGPGLPLDPAKLPLQLRLELAALLQLGVGPLQSPAGRDAPPPEDPESRGLLQGQTARGGPAGHYRVDGALAQDAVASQTDLAGHRTHVRKPAPGSR